MGKGERGKREREIIDLSLHCYHQNDSCIKTGSNESRFKVLLSNESRFKVLLTMTDKVTRHRPQTTTFLKREKSRSGIELRPFCLPT